MSELERVARALAPPYRVEREIGRGALGTTYLTTIKAGTRVAVKVLSRDLVALMRNMSPFVDMLGRAAEVRHPALVPTLGAGVSPEGDVYYAMAYAGGETASDRLARDGAFPSELVASIGATVADGLAAGHQAGIVHGAVAPADLHLDGDAVRLADLGVRTGLVAAGIEMQRLVRLSGAPQYASPEQLVGMPLDARSDVYSLGATLYELLTGRAPHGGRQTTAVMASVLADEPVRHPTPSGPQVPGYVVDSVLRAIEKSPDDRWSSASIFAAALRGEKVKSGVRS